MELKEKGASAEVGSFKQLLCKMKWTTAADFDIGAVYEKDDGSMDMVYYAAKGDLNTFPFIQLDQDAGVGDTGGENEENLRITKLDGKKKIHLVAWDYGAVKTGDQARFQGSDLHIEVKDDTGTNHDVQVDPVVKGNAALLATIEVTPLGATLKNTSAGATFPNVGEFKQMIPNWQQHFGG